MKSLGEGLANEGLANEGLANEGLAKTHFPDARAAMPSKAQGSLPEHIGGSFLIPGTTKGEASILPRGLDQSSGHVNESVLRVHMHKGLSCSELGCGLLLSKS